METSTERFLRQTDVMLPESPRPCRFKVGDKIKFINDQGLEFGPYSVIGFAKPENELGGRFVYIDYSCAWFPVRPDQLEKWVSKPWLIRDFGSLTLVYADTIEEGLAAYKEKNDPDNANPNIFIEPLPGPEKPTSLLWVD